MFAEFDESNFPIVKVKMNSDIDENSFNDFLNMKKL